MGLFSKRENRDEVVLFADVGSGSVAVSVAIIHGNKKKLPEIIFSERENMSFDEKIDPNRLLSLVLNTLDKLLKKVSDSHLGKPARIHCFLRSPWYISQTRTIKLDKGAPFQFNEKLATDLITKEIRAFEGTLPEYYNEGFKFRVIEKFILETKLNGYSVTDPYHKKSRTLEMSLYLSISPEDAIKALEDTFARYYNVPITLSTFLLSSFIVARDTFLSEKDFLIVDVGSEITEVAIVKDSILQLAQSFPMGRNFVIRTLSKKLEVTLDEAMSLFQMYNLGQLNESMNQAVMLVLDGAEMEWLSQFQDALIKISQQASLPSLLILMTTSEVAPWFAKAMEKEQFSQYMVTDKKFNIVPLSPLALKEFSLVKSGVGFDPISMIEAIYLDKKN